MGSCDLYSSYKREQLILFFFFFDQETRAQRSRVTSTSHMFYKVSVLSSQEKGKVTGREELLTWSSRNTGVCVQAHVCVCKHVCVCVHVWPPFLIAWKFFLVAIERKKFQK